MILTRFLRRVEFSSGPLSFILILIWNLSNHGDRMRRFTSGRNSPKRSPKEKRRNEHDSLLQGDEIACRQTQIGRKRRSSGRRSLGAGTSGSSKTRYNESRSSPPDPDRG